MASSDAAEFKLELRRYWFKRYSRSSSGVLDSSGFEHVFVGELRSKVTGFHNWIQFYEQEKSDALQYGEMLDRCEVK